MKLHLAPGLTLPAAVVTEKLGFLGRTGSGKTYAAQLLAEQMHAAGAQFIVLDPVGVWYGLRLAADGKGKGLPIPVLGGLRGDIPIEPTGGALIADLVVDRGTSVILDVSQFESDAQKARFAQDFADRFFFRKKAAPSAVHLFIEEAQEFVPQNPQREETRMLHAFTRLFKIGRNFGVGGSLITQRPQEVNKKVLNLVELLFAFQLTGPQERKTIEGWIADKGLDEDIAGELPKLAVGHPHVWSPAWLKISRVVAIAKKSTYDASSTPVMGKAAVARELSPVDLDALRREMASTIEKAKADDPRELRKKIARLEEELRAQRGKIERVEVPALDEKLVARFEAAARILQKHGLELHTEGEAFASTAEELMIELRRTQAAARQDATPRTTATRRDGPASAATKRASPEPRGEERRPAAGKLAPRGSGSNGSLPRGERRILAAIAQHQEGVTRAQLTILTGYKRSSRDTYLQKLQARGLIACGSIDIVVTGDGIVALGPDFEALPTGDALRKHWLDKLPEGERRILSIVADAYPKAVSRDVISAETGYKRSSRDTYLQKLSARRLVIQGHDGIIAAAELFS
jgi:hypothetical protein